MHCHTTVPNGISGLIFICSLTLVLFPMAPQMGPLPGKPDGREKQ
jgi:hypothetical protein